VMADAKIGVTVWWYGGESATDGPRMVTMTVGGIVLAMTVRESQKLRRDLAKAEKGSL
jgi:hypothetical protein